MFCGGDEAGGRVIDVPSQHSDRRDAALTIPKAALVACAGGVALHLYTALFKAEGGVSSFLVGLFLWSCLPYAIAALLAKRGRRPALALGAALGALAGDLFMHYSVFIAPKSSTAALGLLFMPFWNLVALGPLGAALAWLATRSRRPEPGAPSA